nr:T9SS type A sorting domain-containing protein [Natronogracilivirga saccharolytica]
MKEDQLPTSADQLADAGDVPDEFHLGNYPNPFNSSTRITFELSRQQHVTLNVYDIQGRKIHQLASGSHGSGMHSYDFRADGLSSGVYLYRLETGDKRITRKMMLLQ